MARYFRNRLFGVTSNMSGLASRLLFAAAICLAAPAHASDLISDQEKVVEAVRVMFVAATEDGAWRIHFLHSTRVPSE